MIDRMFDQSLPSTVLGGLSIGLGLILLFSQRRTRTNVGSAALLISCGLSLVTTFPLADQVSATEPGFWARFVVIFLSGGIAAAAFYILGLLSSGLIEQSRPERAIRLACRTNYLLAGLYAVLGVALPAQHLNDYVLSLGTSGFASRPGYWLFATFWMAFVVTFGISWLLIVRQRTDPGEHARAVCFMVASPLLVVTTALPARLALLSGGLAILAILAGQFRYLVAEGERGAFLSRFLSPHVAEQVRTDGLTSVMQPAEIVLTVLACDLRGFTAYAEGVPSQAVIDLLSEYYDTVGSAVAEVDGTIKDFAGDGILILIGAPLPHPDHAAAGLTLARRIHEVTRPVMDRWATPPHPLGIGVGVATGRVTVGAIGSAGRMEYTAVGTPVNLAARLCSAAGAGEILVDAPTARAADRSDLEPRDGLALKGLSHAAVVHTYTTQGAGSAG